MRNNKQVLEQLISVYKNAIVRLQSTNPMHLGDLKYGVCFWLISNATNSEITNLQQVINYWKGFDASPHSIGFTYWCKPPKRCYSTKTLLKSLETRLFILEMEYYSGLHD